MDTLLLNLAYISYVTASLFPSGPKLRLALIAQSIVFIVWGAVSSNRSAIAWNLVFAAINIFQARLILAVPNRVRRSAVSAPVEMMSGAFRRRPVWVHLPRRTHDAIEERMGNMTRGNILGRLTTRGLLAAAVLAVSACGGSGVAEPTEPTIPADATSIVDASARAMGATTSVRFELRREGAPVFIDEFEKLTLNSAIGQFTVPRSAQALLEIGIEGGLTTELGAIALDDEVWLSNPITGNFETLPAGYDIDPSLFFDPENGWQPLMENLSDVTLVGTEERDGNSRYHIAATAPAPQVEVITARLVRNQDVAIEFWIQPVTGEVRESQFSAEFEGGEVQWTLLLSEYGEEFDIQPPQEIET